MKVLHEAASGAILNRPTAILLVLSLAACGDPAFRKTVPEHSTASVEADLRIDPDSADLSPIGVMLVARDGRILVTQTQDGQIRVFGPDGASLGSLGRPGEGPGEFSRLTRIGWIGDSIWALDPGLGRITIFDPDTGLVRSFTSPGTRAQGASDGNPLAIFVQAVLPDGSLRTLVAVPKGVTPPDWAADVDSGSNHYVRFAQDGEVIRRVAVQAPDQCERTFAIGTSGVGSLRIPLCPSPLSNDWDGAVTDFLAFAEVVPGADLDQTSYRVAMLRYDGDTVFVREFPYQPLPVTDSIRDSVLERVNKSMEGMPPAYVSARPSYEMPTTLPPLRRLLIGRDSTLWLEEEDVAPEHRWKVLDLRGDPVGVVTVPAAVRLLVAQRDMVWGAETDENDLEGIVRMRVSLNQEE
ncbi:MAG TPA: 6-bladed beta-propeller [Gemmatimonadales bacterium]|nr:6-bladed beta-propeller [Gemmatimonadales bacterium]